mgnify:CR=1 FL=1
MLLQGSGIKEIPLLWHEKHVTQSNAYINLFSLLLIPLLPRIRVERGAPSSISTAELSHTRKLFNSKINEITNNAQGTHSECVSYDLWVS